MLYKARQDFMGHDGKNFEDMMEIKSGDIAKNTKGGLSKTPQEDL